ncbi:MAG: Ada metal-binding domain-containing protein [Planctomycetota bacterium]|jgi:hypothetical protein
MRQAAIIFALAASWVVCSPTAAIDAESPAVYEIVAATVVTTLPQTVRPFFETHLHDLESAAAAGLARSQEPDNVLSKGDGHYVMLDAGAEARDAEALLAAARRFPQDETEAQRLFRGHGVRAGGRLPWVLEERYGALVAVFQSGDEEAIIREAGALIHLAADAALPFNTTTNREGEATGHLHSSTKKAMPGFRKHRTVRHRLQFQLVERRRERFAHEVRVWPNRFRYIANPADAIFDTLLEAHADVDALLEVDHEVLTSLGIADAAGLADSLVGYYDRLANLAAPLMESRLEAGSLLAANLIGSAWIAAGSPLPTRFAQTPSPLTSPLPVESAAEGDLVGSRNSGIFHRADCPHTKRIGPKNLVSFSGVDEARKAGRRPCKTCNPDLSP